MNTSKFTFLGKTAVPPLVNTVAPPASTSDNYINNKKVCLERKYNSIEFLSTFVLLQFIFSSSVLREVGRSQMHLYTGQKVLIRL